MNTREKGFTLIELMIVVAIIAIIASIAIPNLLSARLNANESSAVATLRNLVSAQAQVQSSAAIDTNANGMGEYGTFGELSGRLGIREANQVATDWVSTGNDTTVFISPPVLSGAFGNVDPNGHVVRSGYRFLMFLPDVNKVGLAEKADGGCPAGVAAANAEVLWAAYAWPAAYGNSGRSTFFVNQQGDTLRNGNVSATPYTGTTLVPTWDAAFSLTAPAPVTMESPLAVTHPNRLGQDNQEWVVVN